MGIVSPGVPVLWHTAVRTHVPGLDIHRHPKDRPQNTPPTLQEGASKDVLCKLDARLGGEFRAAVPRTAVPPCASCVTVSVV